MNYWKALGPYGVACRIAGYLSLAGGIIGGGWVMVSASMLIGGGYLFAGVLGALMWLALGELLSVVGNLAGQINAMSGNAYQVHKMLEATQKSISKIASS